MPITYLHKEEANYLLSCKAGKEYYMVKKENNPTIPNRKDRIRISIPLHWKKRLRDGPHVSAALYLTPNMGDRHSHPKAPEAVWSPIAPSLFFVKEGIGWRIHHGQGHFFVPPEIAHGHAVAPGTFHSAVKETLAWEKVAGGRPLAKGEKVYWVEPQEENGLIIAPHPIYEGVIEMFGDAVKAFHRVKSDWMAIWPIKGRLIVGDGDVVNPFDLVVVNSEFKGPIEGDAQGYVIAWDEGAVP